MTDHKMPITFISDIDAQTDLYGRRNDMKFHRLQQKYADVFPAKVKIGAHNYREREAWENFKKHLLEAGAAVKLAENKLRNLDDGRVLGREAKARDQPKKKAAQRK